MVTLIIKVTVAMTSIITRIRITNTVTRKTRTTAKTETTQPAFQVTIKTQKISNEETLILKWK